MHHLKRTLESLSVDLPITLGANVVNVVEENAQIFFYGCPYTFTFYIHLNKFTSIFHQILVQYKVLMKPAQGLINKFQNKSFDMKWVKPLSID